MSTIRIPFLWGHGSGNAFPIVDARGLTLDDEQWTALARAMADRRGAVGGDGLLALTEGHGGHAFGMRMWNVDGSEAELCLNGLRLVARAGFDALGIDRACVKLAASDAAVERAEPLAPGVVSIAETAGPADLDVAAWPLAGEGHEIVERPITRLSSARAFTAIAMPNPHLVAFVDAIDEAELLQVWEQCEAAPEWLPNRANVSFVRQLDTDTLFVRTAERGVGLTPSCGSAMAASTFAAALTGRTSFGRSVTVLNAGGLVRAEASSDGMVSLVGNATYEWEGAVTFDPVAGTIGDVTVGRHFNDEIAAWGAVAEAAAARL